MLVKGCQSISKRRNLFWVFPAFSGFYGCEKLENSETLKQLKLHLFKLVQGQNLSGWNVNKYIGFPFLAGSNHFGSYSHTEPKMVSVGTTLGSRVPMI